MKKYLTPANIRFAIAAVAYLIIIIWIGNWWLLLGFPIIFDLDPVRVEEGDRVIYPTQYPDQNAAPALPPRPATPEPDRLIIDEARVNLSDTTSSEE